ncbi:hypothetical protein J8281_10485 [Aquimarina sp. U1-2]|uniref:hypothetical protein n=1 Tax=Aquimarina sp. U1-2 TaxID=2823141 RepID=UPI001AECE2C0|nr:hypothetical protein [Aquimarina sp. U1-2]MBP2832611.1 hypothetical protein [Aquimarina sp. U1-2]
MKYIIIMIAIITSLACNKQKVKERPLTTVIKLQSAESILNFEEAKKYIDVKAVFEKYPGSKNPEKEWKEMVSFFYNLGNNKKFTSQFKYYNYNVTETISKQSANVIFTSINKEVKIKKIFYSLEMREENWIVIEIKYIN